MSYRLAAIRVLRVGALALIVVLSQGWMSAHHVAAADVPFGWSQAWPKTDFATRSISLDEIMSGGPGKDGIPAIDNLRFLPAAEITDVAATEPVVGFHAGAQWRAYPLRILMWHEIVNDTVGDIPVAVTYCPLCNSAIVFDRRVSGRTLSFGTTGNLRNSDLVMYDRETESWWQQFTGEAIVGSLTGALLEALPSRVESFVAFKARAGDAALVLVPTDPQARPYGRNPYAGYDTSRRPFLYDGPSPEGIAPLARVIVVGKEAWSLEALQRARCIEADWILLHWSPGQTSALDSATISEGRDIGNVVVQRRTADRFVDAIYDVSFAFAFHAFHPDGPIHVEAPNATGSPCSAN